MRDGVEVSFQIRVVDFAFSRAKMLADLFQCLMRVAFGPEPIKAIFKVGFEDRFHHQQACALNHPVPDGRDSEWAQFTIGFRYVDPPHSLTPIGFVAQFVPQRFQPSFLALALDLLTADPVHPWCSAIGPDLLPGRLQSFGVSDQPIETVEAKTLLLFGFRAQLRSPFTHFPRQLRFPQSQLPYRLFCLRCLHQSAPCLSESACSYARAPSLRYSFEPFQPLL